MDTFLQLFLLVDAFFIGVLSVIAVQHGRAHFTAKSLGATDPAELRTAIDILPEATKKLIINESEAKFQTALNNGAAQLQNELQISSGEINRLVEQLGTKIVTDELERYEAELSQLHKQAEVDMGNMRDEMASHQNELRAKMASEVEAEKQMLIQRIDTKLADAVASFLIEALQHNVDLGAQTPYLTALLDEHKADFAKEVGDETSAPG